MSRPASLEDDLAGVSASQSLDSDNPEDWKQMVAIGIVWNMGEWEIKKALDDLISGKLPMNDNIPANFRAIIEEERSS